MEVITHFKCHSLHFWNSNSSRTREYEAGMLSPRNGLGLEAKNYGLGLGLVASGLGLGLVDVVTSASSCVASWPNCFFRKTLLYV